jgi:hypothetical protein
MRLYVVVSAKKGSYFTKIYNSDEGHSLDENKARILEQLCEDGLECLGSRVYSENEWEGAEK